MKIFTKSHLKSIKLTRKITVASCLVIFAVTLFTALWHGKATHNCDRVGVNGENAPLETTWDAERNCCAYTIPGKGWMANDEIRCLSD